jgi:hypothetical protein
LTFIFSFAEVSKNSKPEKIKKQILFIFNLWISDQIRTRWIYIYWYYIQGEILFHISEWANQSKLKLGWNLNFHILPLRKFEIGTRNHFSMHLT